MMCIGLEASIGEGGSKGGISDANDDASNYNGVVCSSLSPFVYLAALLEHRFSAVHLWRILRMVLST